MPPSKLLLANRRRCRVALISGTRSGCSCMERVDREHGIKVKYDNLGFPGSTSVFSRGVWATRERNITFRFKHIVVGDSRGGGKTDTWVKRYCYCS